MGLMGDYIRDTNSVYFDDAGDYGQRMTVFLEKQDDIDCFEGVIPAPVKVVFHGDEDCTVRWYALSGTWRDAIEQGIGEAWRWRSGGDDE